MTTGCTWRGTETEWNELMSAIAQHCRCSERTYFFAPRCFAHQLLNDQRVVGGLLFGRRVAARLLQEDMGLVGVT
jgi:hypothetical protein